MSEIRSKNGQQVYALLDDINTLQIELYYIAMAKTHWWQSSKWQKAKQALAELEQFVSGNHNGV